MNQLASLFATILKFIFGIKDTPTPAPVVTADPTASITTSDNTATITPAALETPPQTDSELYPAIQAAGCYFMDMIRIGQEAAKAKNLVYAISKTQINSVFDYAKANNKIDNNCFLTDPQFIANEAIRIMNNLAQQQVMVAQIGQKTNDGTEVFWPYYQSNGITNWDFAAVCNQTPYAAGTHWTLEDNSGNPIYDPDPGLTLQGVKTKILYKII